MAGADDHPLQRGLQRERTSLAWSRTALSVLAVGALLAKQSGSLSLAVAVLALVVAASVGMLVLADRRHRTDHRATAPHEFVPATAENLAATVAVVVLALSGLVVLVT